MNKESIDQLARKLAASVPQGLRSMRAELEDNFRAVLKNGLARMDLVTREEFVVQEAVLRRTREKLDVLEQRLQALHEARAAGSHDEVQQSKPGRDSQPPDQ